MSFLADLCHLRLCLSEQTLHYNIPKMLLTPVVSIHKQLINLMVFEKVNVFIYLLLAVVVNETKILFGFSST
jgi:hypothetical protein